MNGAYKTWLGQSVVLQVILWDIQVSLRGQLVKDSDDNVRMRISNGQEVDTNKTTILAVEEAAVDAKFMLAASADEMNGQEWKFVTRHCAAVVLGISKSELGRLSHQSDFVYTESADDEENTPLTNEELQQVYKLGQVH